MGILIQYLLHFSVPILLYCADKIYLSLIPWAGSIALPLLFRGKRNFYPKNPTLDKKLGAAAILISVAIASYMVYYQPGNNITPGTKEYYLIELWKLTPLIFMIHHPFTPRKKK
ncbi:MAG: hypothetical protein Q4E76_06120 [Tissierellia bacterium]|nr:hypothetical protein [Tissierellia bacterium]